MAMIKRLGLGAAILAGALACGGEAATGNGAATVADSGASADAVADASAAKDSDAAGDSGALGDTSAGSDASAVSDADASGDGNTTADTSTTTDTSTDAGASADAISDAKDAGDGSVSSDGTTGNDSSPAADAVDASDAASLCPAPQPPGTICQGSYWVCAPGYFHGYGKTDCLEATCANMKAALDAAIAEVESKAHGCSGGDEGECVVVATTTACQGSCGVAVNGGMANDVALAVGWVDEHICKAFAYADKCGYSTPKCMAPAPACVDGTCVYKP